MLFPLSGDRKPRVHFSGIGGTAMVAGARLAIEAGWEVRGSDNPLYPPTSVMVEQLGVPVYTGYRADNLDWQPDLVIIGNVLSRGNAEVEAALERKLRYVSLPEWLKDVVLRPRRPIVICGTHGKTTTTSLTAFVLEKAGLDPGYFIGGQPLDFPHSARLAPAGAPFVIEGDEYDTAFFDKRAKFLHYVPEIAVVTSLEFDHGDIYRNLGEIEIAFQRMLRQIPKSGWLFLCSDNPGAAALRSHAYSQVATYGLEEGADWRGEVKSKTRGRVQAMTVYRQGAKWSELEVPLAGRHNLQNALAAVAVAGTLGASADAVRDALPEFKGVRRRMETLFDAGGVTFVDDFAHHPTAIRETVGAARARWEGRRLIVLFEPRSNTTVTNRFRRELSHAFKEADEVWFGPIHRAETIPPEERLDRAGIAEDLKRGGVEANYTDDIQSLVSHVHDTAKPGDVVLILSNGAFGGIYGRLRAAYGQKV